MQCHDIHAAACCWPYAFKIQAVLVELCLQIKIISFFSQITLKNSTKQSQYVIIGGMKLIWHLIWSDAHLVLVPGDDDDVSDISGDVQTTWHDNDIIMVFYHLGRPLYHQIIHRHQLLLHILRLTESFDGSRE